MKKKTAEAGSYSQLGIKKCKQTAANTEQRETKCVDIFFANSNFVFAP